MTRMRYRWDGFIKAEGVSHSVVSNRRDYCRNFKSTSAKKQMKSRRAKDQTKDSQIRHIPPPPRIKLDPMRSVPLLRHPSNIFSVECQ